MSTPETDRKTTDIIGFYSCSTVPASFAKRLERERNEAREMLRKAVANLSHGRECQGSLRPNDCQCGYMGLLYAVEKMGESETK